jgi:filamentous hemagglutinin
LNQFRITLDASGNPIIQNGTLNISMGDALHAEYFQTLRPGSKVTSFEIPSWMDNFIKENAISQDFYRSNPLNQRGMAPKIVDPTTPGRSYELPSPWGQWLKENAVPGSGKVK